MADSFFGFNTSLTGLEAVDEPDLDEEEEYDALNDETFGTDAFQGDWEEDHTRFAEVTENSRTYRSSFNSEKDDLNLEASLSQFVLESEEEAEDKDLNKTAKNKTCESDNLLNRFPFRIIESSSPIWDLNVDEKNSKFYKPEQYQEPSQTQTLPKASTIPFLPPQLSRIPTVQELERDLMQKNKQIKFTKAESKSKEVNQSYPNDKNNYPNVSNNTINQNINSSNQFQSSKIQQENAKFPHSLGSNKYPPGFGPTQTGHFNQHQQQELAMLRNNQNMPMQLGPLLLPPSPHLPMLLSPRMPTPLPPHPLFLPQNPRMIASPVLRFLPTHPLLMQQQQQQQQRQQLHSKYMQNKLQNNQNQLKNGISRNNSNVNYPVQHLLSNLNRKGNDNYDEYAGLMNNRERQWLLNIQIIQLGLDKPLVDDYYYTVWSEKQKKLKAEAQNGLSNERPIREPYFANNRQPRNDVNQRERRDSERENATATSPRVYVPLQFENSLGKLQCGSVTAPRKIIDLDVVPDRHLQSTPTTSHRDSRKTKKILLELEMLYLLTMDVEDISTKDSKKTCLNEEAPKPNKSELLEQIMTSYLNEERFVNFMCIRKGKTLLLRVLSFLNEQDHSDHLTNLWCRLFKSVSVIVRRDQNDGILLQIYPYLKKWINTVDCTVLSIIASYLLTANVTNQGKKSSRAVSPNSGKSVLTHILTTTFGVSAVSSILSRGETIYRTLNEKEKQDWTNFILNFIKHMTNIPNLEIIPPPLDPLSSDMVAVILNRSTGLHIQDYASAKRVLTAFNKDKLRSRID